VRHCTGKHRAGPHPYLHRYLQNDVTTAWEGLTSPSKYVEAHQGTMVRELEIRHDYCPAAVSSAKAAANLSSSAVAATQTGSGGHICPPGPTSV